MNCKLVFIEIISKYKEVMDFVDLGFEYTANV